MSDSPVVVLRYLVGGAFGVPSYSALYLNQIKRLLSHHRQPSTAHPTAHTDVARPKQLSLQ
jgi:hypothetical protein